MLVLYVAAGGALGAVLRYGLSEAVRLWTQWPVGTLAVNTLGCLLAGWLWATFDWGAQPGPGRAFFVTGLLGGFTTFSAFSLDTLTLWDSGQRALAVAYGVATVGLTLFAVWAGHRLGRPG